MVGGGNSLERWVASRCAVVVNDSSGMGIGGSTALATASKGDVQPVVVRGLAGINGYVVALSNSNKQTVRSESVHRDQIIFDDCHRVVADGHLKVIFNAGVDDSQTVPLPRGQCHAVIFTRAGGGVWLSAVDPKSMDCQSLLVSTKSEGFAYKTLSLLGGAPPAATISSAVR